VQGRLVPQDPNDEKATVLLERITEEKRGLIKARKIRKAKRLPPLERFSFGVPSSWTWVQLDEICHDTFYGPRFNKNEYIDNGIPTIRTTDMTDDGEIVLKNPPTVQFPDGKKELFLLQKEDLLVTRTGSIGTLAIFRGDYEAIPSAYLIRVRFSPSIFIDYIHLFLKSHTGQNSLGLGTTKTAQPNINSQTLRKIPISFPPLDEQKRIVAKVDELFALCDQLAGQLLAAENGRESLLDAVLAQAV
ncbi:MAG: hypothetical protein GY805_13365, partial [Chloroflexi bacterium]|nr:hypothetical protein [Chloroflexota bacterium]